MKNAIMSFIKRSIDEISQKHHSGKKKRVVFLVSSKVIDGKSRITEMHVGKKKYSEGETAGELQDLVCQWKENGDFCILGATVGLWEIVWLWQKEQKKQSME